MTLKSGILLSVRHKATRLPGKVLKPLAGKPVTEHLLHRLQLSTKALNVVMATSDAPGDEVLADLASALGFVAFRGHPDDKLIRYRDAARYHAFDFVVIVDGDDPFISVSHIDRIIEHYEAHGGDYITFDGLPLGATGFGVSLSALERVCENRGEEDTEIWGHYFTQNASYESAMLAEKDPILARPNVRMTLDYLADYEFFVAVSEGLAKEGHDLSFENVMKHLRAHPELETLNRDAHEDYLRVQGIDGAQGS